MPKHKTREQKIKADERRQAPLYTFSNEKFTAKTPQHVQGNTIALVQHDLRKTALISLIIVTAQVLLFFLLKNHVLAIGFVRY